MTEREKSCGAVVFTRDGGTIRFVLVEQRSGKFSFPKGHVEPGETEEQTALREIWEETGLHPVILPGFRDGETYEVGKKPGVEKNVVYFLAEYSGQSFAPQDTDAVSADLFSYEEAAEILPTKSRKKVLQHAKAFLDRMEGEENLLIRTAVPEDLDAVAAVEAACFPPAEAASREQFAERLKYYGSHFLLLFEEDRLVSFVDGFVTDEPDLTDEMYEKAELHNENGRWQMIFGVNTVPACRKMGYAGMLIRRMISDAKAQGRDGLVLTCKDALVPYYAKFGFVSEGQTSKSTHGGAVWNQMRLKFGKADRKKGEEMKGLYFDGEKAVYREDLPVPRCEDGQSLIRILYADICSTDREILKGYRPDFRGIMGHEFVGVVEESSDAGLVGKTVVGELNEGCGHCIYCRTGREKHCLSRKVIGMSKDGCFAEYMTLATRLLHEVPEGLAPEQAVFTEPLAAAVEILRQVHIDPSLNAAVIGDGRLAYMIAQVLALTGISLTVIGKHPEKLKLFEPFAKTALLSEYFHDGQYRSLSGEECFEYVAEASGNESGIRLALHITRKMGTIILKSTYAGETSINLSEIPVCEFTVVGSRCGPFEPALKLLSEGKVSFPDVELYDLKDFRKAFSSGAFKAGFSFK